MQGKGLNLGAFFLSFWLLAPLCALADEQTQNTTSDDKPSIIRRYSWQGSLDVAGDATQKLEGYNNLNFADCPSPGEPGYDDKLKMQDGAKYLADCNKAKAEAKNISKNARSIRKEQRVLSDVSKVSDAAAVGAIGAVGVSQLMMKDDSQSKSLKKVANIQKVAGYASYASGATDLAIGAYVYAQEKSRLEKMKKAAAASGISKSSPDLNSDLTNAIEKAKSAAYSHMLYGAGKVAVGYGSMWLAKENEKQADKLKSMDNQSASPSSLNASNQKSSTVSSENNSPSFTVLADTTTAENNQNSNETAAAGGAGASSGTSVMPNKPFAFNGKKVGSGAGGSGGSGANAGAQAGAGAAGERAPASGETPNAQENKKSEALDSFDSSMGGGGGSRFHAGSAPKSEESPIVSALNSMLGTDGGAPHQGATGLRPDQIYNDATSGEVQASNESGVNGSEHSLFEITKAKINRSLELGKLSGPGEVEVRN